MAFILCLFTACDESQSTSSTAFELTIKEKIKRAPKQQRLGNHLLSAKLVANKSSFNNQFNNNSQPIMPLAKQAGALIFLSASNKNANLANLGVTKLLLLNGTQVIEIPASTLRYFPVKDESKQLIMSLPNGIDAQYAALEFDDKGQKRLLSVSPSLSNNTHQVYVQGKFIKSITNKLAFQPILRNLHEYGSGASVMASVIKKFGKNISEYDAAQGMLKFGESERIIKRRTFSLLDMKKYLVATGHDAAGYYSNNLAVTLPKLFKEQQNTVAIVLISLYGNKHFAILTGYDDTYYYFASPILGNISVKKSEAESGSIWSKSDRGHIIFLARK